MKPNFEKMNGLLPVVVQNARTGEVLMLGYMNQEAHDKTTETGLLHLWSRSRGSLWLKGESSGHLHKVVGLILDCDRDALLVETLPNGPTCHTGEISCFHNIVKGSGFEASKLRELEDIIRDRLSRRPEGSYTWNLAKQGRERVAKKIIEEAGEAALAYLSGSDERFLEEAADLVYHLLISLAERELSWSGVEEVLKRRRK